MFKKYLKIYPGISCFLFHTTFTAHTRPIEPNTGENMARPLAATKNKRHPFTHAPLDAIFPACNCDFIQQE